MNIKVKLFLAIFVFLGCLLLVTAAIQWYDLNLIEEGVKEGELPILLNGVYQVFGKWGVALTYVPFAGYCFWRAYSIVVAAKGQEQDENNEILDNERE